MIHKKQGGVSDARNKGIMEAEGKYIMFMNNDEEVLDGFVDTNYELAEEYNADCVHFGWNLKVLRDKENIIKSVENRPDNLICLEGEKIFSKFDQIIKSDNFVWTGLYRRQLMIVKLAFK